MVKKGHCTGTVGSSPPPFSMGSRVWFNCVALCYHADQSAASLTYISIVNHVNLLVVHSWVEVGMTEEFTGLSHVHLGMQAVHCHCFGDTG